MNIHIYRQTDKRWSSLAYPTYSSSFGGNGCGACAILHCIIEMEKYKNWTPTNIQPYMKQFAVNHQGTTWAGIPQAMTHYGLKNVKNISTMEGLWKELSKGNRVGILLFGSRRGPDGTVWTNGGHYIAFVDYKFEKGQHWLYLKDSGDRKHDKWWSYEKSMRGDVVQVWSGALPSKHVDNDPYKQSLKKTGYTGKIPANTVGRKYGSTTDVKKWQKFLNWWYEFNLVIDGDFGNKTEAATVEFQEAHGLVADGIAGPNTFAKAKTYLKKETTPTTSKTSKTPFTKVKGMDISAWQGKVSKAGFEKAKNSGIKFVILRVGYTGSSSKKPTIDSVFENNYKNAIAAGLPVGIYFYSLATTKAKAKEEAEFVIRNIKGKKITYPVYIDVEDPTYQSKCSKSTLAAVCNSFCKTINAAGYTAGVYASLSWFNNKIDNITEKHTKWVAQYYTECQYKGKYDIWQYSSSGKVPGLEGNIDMNWCYKQF